MEPSFELTTLYAALDAQRESRGLTWTQAVREINAVGPTSIRQIAVSTVTGLPSKTLAEGDGVLQMLRWLKRSPESFLRDSSALTEELPEAKQEQVLRFDTPKLYEALNARRTGKGMTWPQVAGEIGGLRAASLTRYSKGGRTAFPEIMRICRWLGKPAATFVRVSSW